MKRTILSLSLLLLLAAGAVSVWFLWTYYQSQSAENQAAVRIAVIGDNEGVNDSFETILNKLEYQDIDVLVNVADLTVKGERQELQQVLDRLQYEPYRTEVVVGNNDLGPNTDPDYTNFLELVRNPAYTSFDVGNVHLVLLDNANRRVGFSEEELVWLNADLVANIQPHVLLFMHRPIQVPFENVLGTDETKASRASTDRFLGLIKKYSITHIFTGHLETFLEYELEGIPVTVTGGAHDREDKTGFGVTLPSEPHYTLITISNEKVKVEKVPLKQ